MTFVKTLRQAGVSHASTPIAVVALFGIVLWSTPFALYITGLVLSWDDSRTTSERALWTTNVAAHVLTGVFVLVDALCYGGKYWPLQMLVIGFGSYATLALPALGSMALVRNDTTGTAVAFAALGSACVANAAMLAIIFELFHRSRAPFQNEYYKTVQTSQLIPSLSSMR